MESLVPIGIWIVLGLAGLSLLTIAIFGIRSVSQGKIKTTAIVVLLIPALLLIGLGFGLGGDSPWERAAVITFLTMLVLTAGSLLLTGVKTIFN